jgi:hypothetical protein
MKIDSTDVCIAVAVIIFFIVAVMATIESFQERQFTHELEMAKLGYVQDTNDNWVKD